MRKTVRYIILGVILCIGAWLLALVVSGIRHKHSIAGAIGRLPSLTLPLADGGEADIRSLVGSHFCVIIYFSPDCEHCQYETAELRKSLPAFREVEILMITRANQGEAKAFARRYGLDSISNIHFLLDPSDRFYKTFGTHQFPSLFIYDKSQRLVKKFIGETKMEAVIHALE